MPLITKTIRQKVCVSLSVLLFASLHTSCGTQAKATHATDMVAYFPGMDASAVYDASGKLLPHPDCRAYTAHHITPSGSLVEDLISLGKIFLGKPYRYRKGLPWAMDCSGYVRYLYACFGVSLSGSSASLSKQVVRTEAPQPGDLLFFKGRNRRSKAIGHVALVIDTSPKGITMMHSTNTQGVIIQRLETTPYFKSRYLFAGRVPQLDRLRTVWDFPPKNQTLPITPEFVPIPSQALLRVNPLLHSIAI